jgi:CBS domain containing-hemolysin-like protein
MNTLPFPTILAMSAETVAHEWDMTGGEMLWNAGVVLFFVLLNGFFVAAEFAIVKVRESQLQEAANEGNSTAHFAQGVTKHLDAYLSATQLGITLASIALGMVGEPYIAHMLQPLLFRVGIASEQWVHGIALGLAYAIITFLHVVLGELTPKSLAIRKALATTLIISRPLHLFYLLLKPAIVVLNGTANWILRVIFRIDPVSESERVHSEEELKHIVSESSEHSDEVTETEKHIVLNALSLNDRYVRDVMTPRKDVVWLDVGESFETNLKIALECKHTRFPLVEGHLDHSVGLIHIKDVLKLTQETGKRDLRTIKRELLMVPEMMPIDKLLRMFLEKHAHLALAADEYGGAVGIVTLDNVVEEIVGDIQDEFDHDKPEFRRINDNEFEVEGMLNLYEINDLTELELESDEVTTIGGYVTHALGHFPKQGETVIIENYEVTATKVEARRVVQLHFRRIMNADGTADESLEAAVDA